LLESVPVKKPVRSLTNVEEERAVPWGDPGLFSWHLARYEFAIPFVKSKRVLDVGSGEGYGAALLAEQAHEVLGIDYSPEAVRHARRKYMRDNLQFRVMNAMALNPGIGEFDVVTCFEVIEHIEDHDALLSGVAGLLRSGGLLLLSTPNRTVDKLFESVSRREHYEYHINMLNPQELRKRARPYFTDIKLYGQTAHVNTLHSMLKSLDFFNLRHRLVRSARVQRALLTSMAGEEVKEDVGCRFSRTLARQSATVVLVARRRSP
jgi:SAM-dependent methyltransferase